MADDAEPSTLGMSDEGARVVAWRHRQLLAAGASSDLAFQVAVRTDIDLHRACKLLAAGCPPEQVAAILI